MRRAFTGRLAFVVFLVALVAAIAGIGAWRASTRVPSGPSLEGPCRVEANLSPGSVVVDPSRSGGVYTVPPAATITYDAVLSTAVDQGARRITGRVVLELPPPLPDATLARWDEIGRLPDTAGARRYDMPSRWAPTGLTVRVRAEHHEPSLRCSGALDLRLGRGSTTSLLRPVAIVVLVGSAWLVAGAARPARPRRRDPWVDAAAPAAGGDEAGGARQGRRTTGEHPGREPGDPAPSPVASTAAPARHGTGLTRRRGRPLFGAASGLLFGLSTAFVLLLCSAVPLQSAWITAALLVGAGLGTGLGLWGSPAAGAAAGEDGGDAGEPEVPLLPLVEPGWAGSAGSDR